MTVHSVQCRKCKYEYHECAAENPCRICPNRNTPKCPICGYSEVFIIKKLTNFNDSAVVSQPLPVRGQSENESLLVSQSHCTF